MKTVIKLKRNMYLEIVRILLNQIFIYLELLHSYFVETLSKVCTYPNKVSYSSFELPGIYYKHKVQV